MKEFGDKAKRVNITLPKNCEVEKVSASVENGCIVVEYTPKSMFKPKGGDICYMKTSFNNWIFIFKYNKNGTIHDYSSLNLSIDNLFINNIDGDNLCKDIDISSIRLATEKEKQILFDKLKERGFKWNEKEKKIEKIRWRAELERFYYYINSTGVVESTVDIRHRLDNNRYAIGNYFKTEEEAKPYLEKFKEIFKDRL